jgi:hypothetical protein
LQLESLLDNRHHVIKPIQAVQTDLDIAIAPSA